MNQAIIVGRIGKDAVLKHTATGTPVVNFSVATNRMVGTEKMTDWHNVFAAGKYLDFLGPKLKKGVEVYVLGSVQTRSWEKDGVKQFKTEINAKTLRVFSDRENTTIDSQVESPEDY